MAGETVIHQAEQLLQSVLPLLLHHHVLHVDVGCKDVEPEKQHGDHHPSDEPGLVGVTLAQHVLHLQFLICLCLNKPWLQSTPENVECGNCIREIVVFVKAYF